MWHEWEAIRGQAGGAGGGHGARPARGCLLSTLLSRRRSQRDGGANKRTLVISLAVWSLMAWEHGAESTGESSNIMRPYLRVRLAETVMESRERRPVYVYVCVCTCARVCVCVRRMWKTNEHRNVG